MPDNPQDIAQDKAIEKLEGRMDAVEGRVGDHETKLAVVDTKMDNVSEAITTGMTDIKLVMAATIAKRDQDDRDAAAAAIVQADKDRDANKWWWGKAFAIVGALVTALTAIGGGVYSTMDSEPEAAPISAPAPAPTGVTDGD